VGRKSLDAAAEAFAYDDASADASGAAHAEADEVHNNLPVVGSHLIAEEQVETCPKSDSVA
jgi:hypothetical protein